MLELSALILANRPALFAAIVCVLVEVGDAADHGGTGDDLIAVGRQFRHQRHVLAVAEHEAVIGVAVMGFGDRAVFAEIVDADDMVPVLEQLGDDITRNEAGGSGDQDFHVLSALGKPAAAADEGREQPRLQWLTNYDQERDEPAQRSRHIWR
jgi:hypothetical protein